MKKKQRNEKEKNLAVYRTEDEMKVGRQARRKGRREGRKEGFEAGAES